MFKKYIWFLDSLRAFIMLSNAGFRISYSKNNYLNTAIFRFFWGEKAINDMADIDVDFDESLWSTMYNGITRTLKKGDKNV